MNTRTRWTLALVAILGLCASGAAEAAETVDDSYSTPRTTQLSVATPGILANDTCDSCAVVSVDGHVFEGQISFGPSSSGGDPLPQLNSGSGASLTMNSDGSLTYDPSTIGDATLTSDSFTYQAEDSRGLSAEATVTITLTDEPTSSAPVANDDAYTVELGTVLTVAAPGVLENDTDADGDPLSIALIDGAEPTFGSPVALAYGTLTIQADGSLTYEPNPDALVGAEDGFTYTASDGTNLSSSASVGFSIGESTTGDTVVNVRFDDVGLVVLDAEVGRSDVDQLEIGAAYGSQAQVSGAGLAPQTAALVLRSSGSQTAADAREAFKGCERMALLAQAQPSKYDLVVEVHSETPGDSFSSGGDGEVIIEVAETRFKCWTSR